MLTHLDLFKRNKNKFSLSLAKKMFVHLIMYSTPSNHIYKISRKVFEKGLTENELIIFMDYLIDDYFCSILKRLILKDGNGINFLADGIDRLYNDIHSYDSIDEYTENDLVKDFFKIAGDDINNIYFKKEESDKIKENFKSHKNEDLYIIAMAIYTHRISLDKMIYEMFKIKNKALKGQYYDLMKENISDFVIKNKIKRKLSSATTDIISHNNDVLVFMYVYNNFIANR